jgi:ADP-ribose pyrophosphatase
MTSELSERQREALALYYQLTESRPGMFGGRERRPIVLDRAVIETYAREHSDVVLGVALATPYLWVLNDLVRSRDQAGNTRLHPYLRMVPPQGVGAGQPGTDEPGTDEPDADASIGGAPVVLATVPAADSASDERIVLVEQERHETGKLELELPRGFGAPGVPAGDQALRELAEETGYRGAEARLLGKTNAFFFHVPVTGQGEAAPESGEAITRVVLLTRDELWEHIDSGAVGDAFTLQALGLYEHRLRTG